jgi:hypothetical protein
VKGDVLYNDLREDGDFSLRGGMRNRFKSEPAVSDNKNYLGLLDGTVRIYEHDLLNRIESCVTTELVGSTLIDNSGHFSWQGQVCDRCTLDDAGAEGNGVSVVAEVTLENCAQPETRCFSVRDPNGAGVQKHYEDEWDGKVWAAWHRGASPDHPLVARAHSTVNAGTDYFQRSAGPSQAQVDDLQAQAANVFASMVDVTRRIHLGQKVPFDHARWGQIKAYFPSVIGSSTGGAHSHQADRLCIGAPQVPATIAPETPTPTFGPKAGQWTGEYQVLGDNDYDARQPEDWVDGHSSAHEYGHLVHYWAWNGFGKWTDFCFQGDCAESLSTPEYPYAAFKEAWAEFVSHFAFDGESGVQNTCSAVENDPPVGCNGPGKSATLCSNGRRYIVDVKHALCDLWDGSRDSALWSGSRHYDDNQISFYTMRQALHNMWSTAEPAYKQEVIAAYAFEGKGAAKPPLGLCNYAGALVDLGAGTLEAIRSTLAVNGIDCGL